MAANHKIGLIEILDMMSSVGWVNQSAKLTPQELETFIAIFTPNVPTSKHQDLKNYLRLTYNNTLDIWQKIANLSANNTSSTVKSPLLQHLKDINTLHQEAISALNEAIKALTALERTDGALLEVFDDNLSKNNLAFNNAKNLNTQVPHIATELVILKGALGHVKIELPETRPRDILTRNLIMQLANLWVEFTGEAPKRHFNMSETGPFFSLCKAFMLRLEDAIPKELRKYIPQSTRLDYHVRAVLKEYKDAKS